MLVSADSSTPLGEMLSGETDVATRDTLFFGKSYLAFYGQESYSFADQTKLSDSLCF